MARAVEADVLDRLERQALVVDLDAFDRALRGADDVVVDDQALEREAEQARVHAGRLVDQVGAGIADQRVVERLLGARLGVGQLRVGHAGGGAAGQVVEVGHLAAAAESSACSGLPPDIAPVRRSETKHQVPKIAGCPGLIAFT